MGIRGWTAVNRALTAAGHLTCGRRRHGAGKRDAVPLAES